MLEFHFLEKNIFQLGSILCYWKKSYYMYLIHSYFAWKLTAIIRKGVPGISPSVSEKLIYVCAVIITVIGISTFAEGLQRVDLFVMRLKKYKC